MERKMEQVGWRRPAEGPRAEGGPYREFRLPGTDRNRARRIAGRMPALPLEEAGADAVGEFGQVDER